jgi:hypothetical protein
VFLYSVFTRFTMQKLKAQTVHMECLSIIPFLPSFIAPPCQMTQESPSSVIARAIDHYRIRTWLAKGPRCACQCGERIPWSDVNPNALDTCSHISTHRRPHSGVCDEELLYIPSTVEGFRKYIVRCFRMGMQYTCGASRIT